MKNKKSEKNKKKKRIREKRRKKKKKLIIKDKNLKEGEDKIFEFTIENKLSLPNIIIYFSL